MKKIAGSLKVGKTFLKRIGDLVMNINRETYIKIITYLDIIEAELNKIAAEIGHPSFEDFFKEEDWGLS